MRLNNKTAIITGAAGGIGRAIAALFAREGARITAADLDASGGRELVGEITNAKGRAIFVSTNVSKPADAASLAAKAVAQFGTIDILVNAAAVASFSSSEETSEAELDRVLNANLKSVFLCSQAVIPQMKQAGGGSIIHLSSITGIVGAPGMAAYAASKGAIITLTRTMALELAVAGIRVNCLCPASIDTPMLQAAFDREADPARAREQNIKRHPLKRLGTPEDVAHFALFLASDESGFVTGGTHVIDGGALLARRWQE